MFLALISHVPGSVSLEGYSILLLPLVVILGDHGFDGRTSECCVNVKPFNGIITPAFAFPVHYQMTLGPKIKNVTAYAGNTPIHTLLTFFVTITVRCRYNMWDRRLDPVRGPMRCGTSLVVINLTTSL